MRDLRLFFQKELEKIAHLTKWDSNHAVIWKKVLNLDERVIFDVMDELVWPPGIYPENFIFISLLKVCQEWAVLYGGFGGHWVFLTGDLEDNIILDV